MLLVMLLVVCNVLLANGAHRKDRAAPARDWEPTFSARLCNARMPDVLKDTTSTLTMPSRLMLFWPVILLSTPGPHDVFVKRPIPAAGRILRWYF